MHLIQPKGLLLTDTLMKHVKALELEVINPTRSRLGLSCAFPIALPK
jgi:hypothetical protein